VESFANVPTILRRGSEWYASLGTKKSKGTKVFALCGKVRNVGLIEVPMGTPLRQIILKLARGTRRAQVQGGADRRTFRWLHPSNFLIFQWITNR